MGRLRATLAAIGVAVGVFAYLALPLLRELYGPWVDLPVFAAIALFAGLFTYVGLRQIQGYLARKERQTPDANEVLVQGELYRVDGDGEDGDGEDGDGGGRESRPSVDVETEMEQLRDEED